MTNQSVTWVIERHIFEEKEELALIEEVKKQGGEVKLIDPLSKDNFDYETSYWLEDRPVVFRGSLNIAEKAKHQAWYPGVICHPKNFNCSTYYTYWGKWMLNKEYNLMPIAELRRIAESSFINQTYFIKPDFGMKPFTGKVFNLFDLSLLKHIEPETLVLIAPVKLITKEWRFVVCNNKVIYGCQYSKNKKCVNNPDNYANALTWLSNKLNNIKWQPDSIYTIDVCESEEEFEILELNSFSCSALYSCDLSKVVEAANKIAIKEWNNINE